MKFLLDENVHRGLFSFLVDLGHDVKLSPKSIKNGKVFELALKEERVLISQDADFSAYKSSKHLETQKRAISILLKNFLNVEGFRDKFVKISSDEDFEFL